MEIGENFPSKVSIEQGQRKTDDRKEKAAKDCAKLRTVISFVEDEDHIFEVPFFSQKPRFLMHRHLEPGRQCVKDVTSMLRERGWKVEKNSEKTRIDRVEVRDIEGVVVFHTDQE